MPGADNSEDPAVPTHNAAVLGIHTLEVPCNLENGLTQVGHQLRLLDVLGFQCLQIVIPWGSARSQREGEERKTSIGYLFFC